MAQRGGFFGTLGGLFKLAILGLAAIFVVTIWFAYTSDDETVVAETETVQATETASTTGATPARAPETPESAAAQEAATPAPNPASTGGAAIQQGTGLADTRPVDEASPDETPDSSRAEPTPEGVASEEARAPEPNRAETDGAALQQGTGLEGTRPVDGSSTQEVGTPATTLVEGAVAGATQSASEALSGAGDGSSLTIPMPEPMTTIDVIGDNTAVYAFVDAVRDEDGAIELTTARTENGETTYVTRRVTCDPLAADIVAEGPDPDSLVAPDGLADPAPVAEGSPEAALASYACSLEF